VKPLSIKQIDQLRKLLRRASKPAPVTSAERNAARRAKVAAHKAAVLAYCQQHWDERYAALRAEHPACFPELGIGERPNTYRPSLAHQYARRDHPIY
jgi:hypothetical protein